MAPLPALVAGTSRLLSCGRRNVAALPVSPESRLCLRRRRGVILLHTLPATLMWIVHTQDSQEPTRVLPSEDGLQEPPAPLWVPELPHL